MVRTTIETLRFVIAPQRAGMIGTRSAKPLRASGQNRPHSKAGYMTAPDRAKPAKKLLAGKGPPIHDRGSSRPDPGEGLQARASKDATAVLPLPSFKHRLALFGPGLKRLGMVFGTGAAGARGGERVAVEPAGGDLVDRALEA